jgi:Histidine kinase
VPLIVPATALSTVSLAAFLGWSIARRVLELRLEERINERTRIARDLHDTLLQSFIALLLRLQTVSNVLPAQPEEAKRRVDQAIEQQSPSFAYKWKGRQSLSIPLFDMRCTGLLPKRCAMRSGMRIPVASR